jgi:fumarate reductase subunit C
MIVYINIQYTGNYIFRELTCIMSLLSSIFLITNCFSGQRKREIRVVSFVDNQTTQHI